MVWLHECESLMRARTLAQKPPHLVLNRYTFKDAVALKPGQAPTRAIHREIEAAFFTRGHAWRACLHALERTKKSKEYARRGGGGAGVLRFVSSSTRIDTDCSSMSCLFQCRGASLCFSGAFLFLPRMLRGRRLMLHRHSPLLLQAPTDFTPHLGRCASYG